jgi:hypothetical protein
VGDVLLSYQSDTEALLGGLKRAREFSQRAVESAEGSHQKEIAVAWRLNEGTSRCEN